MDLIRESIEIAAMDGIPPYVPPTSTVSRNKLRFSSKSFIRFQEEIEYVSDTALYFDNIRKAVTKEKLELVSGSKLFDSNKNYFSFCRIIRFPVDYGASYVFIIYFTRISNQGETKSFGLLFTSLNEVLEFLEFLPKYFFVPLKPISCATTFWDLQCTFHGLGMSKINKSYFSKFKFIE